MGLRNYINDLEFSKKINLSERGRRFEDSDFARSTEAYIQAEKECLSGDVVEKIYGLVGLLSPYFVVPMMYAVIKISKMKKYPIYETIRNDSALMLNH